MKRVEFKTKAMKDIAKNIQEAKNYDINKLKGFKDIFRLRKGDYRVIFEVRENKFTILHFGDELLTNDYSHL